MAIQFQNKKVNVANGVFGIYLPENIKRIENCKTLKERADWYRRLLNIENALFFSENIGIDGGISGETLIVLDVNPDKIDANTKYNFATEGHTGQYTIPLFFGESLMTDVDRLFKFVDDLNEKSDTEEESITQ